jgi:hypothetical protein
MNQYYLYKKKLEKIFNRISKIAFKGRDNRIEYFDYIDELIQNGDYGAFEQTLYYFYQIDLDLSQDLSIIKENTWSEVVYQTTTPFLKKLSKMYKDRKIYQSSFDIHSDDPSRATLQTTGPLSPTYSVLGTSSSISMTRQGEKIFINVLDSDIFNIQISKTVWANNQPGDLEFTQNIRVGTSSSIYQTNIPVSHGAQYLIKTEERSSYQEKNYKFVVDKSTLLGQIYERETFTEDTKYLMQNKLYAKVIGSATFYLEVQKIGATSSLIISQSNPSLSDVQNLINNYTTAIDYLLS